MRRLVVLCCVTLCAMFSGAQDAEGIWQTLQTNADMARRMGYQPYRVDSTQTKTLGIELEALAFFKDNEFDGNVQRGYSLPGVRLQPRLTYTPIDEIKLELGLHATIYSGANKYPCYVFHDIATWKGDQYQSGAHLLPFFRATARFKSITLAVGDIYGGATHGFRPCIVRKNPQVPNTARQVASLPGDTSRGKRSSMPQPKTRPDSPVPSLQGPCDRSLKSEVPCGSCLNWR